MIAHRPTLQELHFRERLLSDEETMSYNAAWGGSIPFPTEAGIPAGWRLPQTGDIIAICMNRGWMISWAKYPIITMRSGAFIFAM